jgi:hypothetical protein
MKAGQFWMIIVFLVFPLLCAAQQKDTIFLFNGQILIGDVLGGELGVLSLDETDLGVIKIKLYKIRMIKTSKEFKIETSTRDIYYGSMQVADVPGRTNIMSGDLVLESIELTDISNISSLEKQFWTRLQGNISAGLSYTKSSNVGQINLNSDVLFVSKKMAYQLHVSEYISIDSSKYSRDREQYELFVNYDFTPSWFVAGLTSYQRNLELSLARRLQEMVGAGYKLLVEKQLHLLLVSGLTFNQEKSTAGVESGLLLEIPVMLRFNFFRFKSPNMQISSTQTGYFSIFQKGRIRYDSNTQFSWELFKNFWLSMTPYGSFDNRPPEGGNTFDFGITVGLSYKF